MAWLVLRTRGDWPLARILGAGTARDGSLSRRTMGAWLFIQPRSGCSTWLGTRTPSAPVAAHRVAFVAVGPARLETPGARPASVVVACVATTRRLLDSKSGLPVRALRRDRAARASPFSTDLQRVLVGHHLFDGPAEPAAAPPPVPSAPRCRSDRPRGVSASPRQPGAEVLFCVSTRDTGARRWVVPIGHACLAGRRGGGSLFPPQGRAAVRQRPPTPRSVISRPSMPYGEGTCALRSPSAPGDQPSTTAAWWWTTGTSQQ